MERVKLSRSGWKRFVGIVVAITLIPALACACSSGQNRVESKQETAIPEMPQSSEQQGDADIPQGEILPYTPDLNHNGIAEILVKDTLLDSNGLPAGERVEVWENGQVIWPGKYDILQDSQAVFLCTIDGKDYMLKYSPSLRKWRAFYDYRLFSLDESPTHENVLHRNSVEFDLNSGGNHESFEPTDIAAFMDEINVLLESSVQLWNMSPELAATFEKEGQLVDTLWWLDYFPETFTRNQEAGLMENLEEFQKVYFIKQGPPSWDSAEYARDAYLAVLDNSLAFYDTDDDEYLTMEQKFERLRIGSVNTGISKFTVMDLDKDNTPEIVCLLHAGTIDTWGVLILHYEDGTVYGYTKRYRSFAGLKEDGTYTYNSGLAIGCGYCTISFAKADYEENAFLYYSGIGDVFTFYHNGEIITEEEYYRAIDLEEEKADAKWYNFTSENLEILFP